MYAALLVFLRQAFLQALNKNVNWISSPGAWVFYMSLILLGWLSLSLVVDSGTAWTYIHLLHGLVTYYLLHWNKGSPVEMDQGKYDSQTFWEQLDDGVQYTPNRKFFTAVPVVLFLLATHGSDFRKQPLGLNLIVLAVLLIAKFPGMHRVRILGINKYWEAAKPVLSSLLLGANCVYDLNRFECCGEPGYRPVPWWYYFL